MAMSYSRYRKPCSSNSHTESVALVTLVILYTFYTQRMSHVTSTHSHDKPCQVMIADSVPASPSPKQSSWHWDGRQVNFIINDGPERMEAFTFALSTQLDLPVWIKM